MEQIPDAPWIREAETKGYPPDADPDFDCRAEFENAQKNLTEAMEALSDAIDILDGTTFEGPLIKALDELDEISSKLDGIRREIWLNG